MVADGFGPSFERLLVFTVVPRVEGRVLVFPSPDGSCGDPEFLGCCLAGESHFFPEFSSFLRGRKPCERGFLHCGYLTFWARGYGSARIIFPLSGSMLSRGA